MDNFKANLINNPTPLGVTIENDYKFIRVKYRNNYVMLFKFTENNLTIMNSLYDTEPLILNTLDIHKIRLKLNCLPIITNFICCCL